MRLIEILREIRNYIYLRGVIRRNKNTPEWTKLNLRLGWFGVIYTVVNLPPEVFEGEEVYYQVFIIEKMKPINDYLASLNLQEIISPQVVSKVKKDEGEFAYLVKYLPLFRELTLGWVFQWTSIVAFVSWIQFKFDVLSKLKIVYDFIYQWILTR
jgi:hypothetical protein